MKVQVKKMFLVVGVLLVFAYGISWAENGIGGATDFNADEKSRIATIEEGVEVNQANIADNAAGISENSARISVNENDIATLMGSGSGVGPGIANAILQSDEGLPPIPVNTTAVIVSASINAPVDGYVLAMASLQFFSDGICDLGVSTSATLPPYQDVSADTGAASVHGIFTVSAGENWINLLGRSRNDSVCRPNDVNLSLVFFPASSAYGPVTSN